MSWVSAQRDLDPTSKFLLHRLALYADAEGCAWASVPTLAAECNVSERTVQYKMRAMEDYEGPFSPLLSGCGLTRETCAQLEQEMETAARQLVEMAENVSLQTPWE